MTMKKHTSKLTLAVAVALGLGCGYASYDVLSLGDVSQAIAQERQRGQWNGGQGGGQRGQGGQGGDGRQRGQWNGQGGGQNGGQRGQWNGQGGPGGQNRQGDQGGQGGDGRQRGQWNGQGGGQNGGQRGQWNGGQGGQNRQGGQGRFGGQGGSGGQRGPGGGPGGFTPEQIIQNMTAERFERLRNTPFAENIKNQVGGTIWAQWESGNFSASASAADQAAAAAEGRPLSNDMTDEEKAEAEALLRSGQVPNFNGGAAPYSTESENQYYQEALAHRDDTLVPALQSSLRYYYRYLMKKYDLNGNGILERREWENKISGAQAIDLDGDWDLTDQEVLFYLARYAKDRSIADPEPRKAPVRMNAVVDDSEKPILIRPASAAPKRATAEELEEETSYDLADMSDDEFVAMMTENNPALESVEDEELLDVLLADMDESSVREYAAAPKDLVGTPVWFLSRDRNGDGQLSLVEFAPNLSPSGIAQFGKIDANHDGLITAEEVRQFTAGANTAGAN